MDKKDIIAWKRGFEVAHEVERRLISQEPVNPDRAIRLALSLITTCLKYGTWINSKVDINREEGVNQVRNRWIVLRKALVK